MVKTRKKIKWKDELVGWLFILPVVLGILIFTALPLIYAFVESFFETPLREFSFAKLGKFVGLKNYTKNFTRYAYSAPFWQSLKVTFVYALINVPLQLALSFLLALFLNRKIRGIKVIRALFYLPVLIPPVCSGILWKQLTDVNYGVMNNILKSIGIKNWGWFNEAASAMPSLIFISLFNLGGSMILWLAQLKNIPKALYESARLDGANKFTQLVKITIPMCAPMIVYNLVMSIIATLQTYDLVATLVNMGGVQDSMLFYIVNVYLHRTGEFGYTCALSFMLFFITAALSMTVMRFSKNIYYGEEG